MGCFCILVYGPCALDGNLYILKSTTSFFIDKNVRETLGHIFSIVKVNIGHT